MKTNETKISEFLTKNAGKLHFYATRFIYKHHLQTVCEPDELVYDAIHAAYLELCKNANAYLSLAWIKKNMWYRLSVLRARKRKKMLETYFEEAPPSLVYRAAANRNEQEQLELQDLIRSVMSRLNRDHKQILSLYAEGYSVPEMAGQLNISQSAAAQRLTRAKSKFKQCITLLLNESN